MLQKLRHFTPNHVIAICLSAIAGIYVIQIGLSVIANFSDVLIVLVLSWLISFIFEPLVVKLQSFGLKRLLATSVVYIVVGSLLVYMLVLAIPLLVNQITALALILPGYIDQVPGWANKIVDFSLSALNNSLSLVQKIASLLFYLAFILILSFYFVLDKDNFWSKFIRLLPKDWHDEATFLKKIIDDSFAGFLRAQVILGVIFGIITSVVLLFVSPEFSLLAGILSGFLLMLPIIGPVAALIPAFVVMLPLGLSTALWLTLLLFTLQSVELNVFGPKILGNTMRLHPIWVLVALLLGFKIAGVWGSLFAIPVASIIGVIITVLLPHLLHHTE